MIWTPSLIKAMSQVPKQLAVGLLDTSVVIDLDHIPLDALPKELAISSITLAELSAGPAATSDAEERARRQDRLQRAESVFEPIPFGTDAARAYGRVYAAVRESGRASRGRLADLLIAAVALAEGLPVITRNAPDFAGLESLVQIVAVE